MRFLLIRNDYLGDGILSSTFIKKLHEITDATIDVLSYDYNRAAFEYHPLLTHKFYLYPKASNTKERQHNKVTFDELSKETYDAVFVLNRNLKNYKLLKYVKTKKVFGHKVGIKSMRSKMYCFFAHLFFRYQFVSYSNLEHEVVNLDTLVNFGLDHLHISHQNHKIEQRSYFYYSPTHEHVKLEDKLFDHVVVNISGRVESVRYLPFSLSVTIIDALIKKHKQVLVVATLEDVVRLNKLKAIFENMEQVKFFCESKLLHLSETMDKYAFFVGADGGLAHIAAGLGLRCVTLFHTQNIYAWHPWTRWQISLQTPNKRIYDLTADDVMGALQVLGLELDDNV